MKIGVLRAISLAAVLMVLSACASIKLNSVWRDNEYAGSALRKIVVIGVSDDTATRRIFEEDFSKALSNSGTTAIPGYRLIPDNPQRSVDAMRTAIAQSGADGIMLARALRTEQKTEYTPGTVYFQPHHYHRDFWGLYGTMLINEPQIHQYTVVTIETQLWAVASNSQVVWSATSQATNPKNVKQVTAELARIVIGALREQQLIAQETQQK